MVAHLTSNLRVDGSSPHPVKSVSKNDDRDRLSLMPGARNLKM